MSKRWLGAIAGVAAAAALSGMAFANAPTVQHVKTARTVVPVKTMALRDMRNLDLPAVMRRIVGNKYFTRQQLEQLRQKLVDSGYLKPAASPYTIPLRRIPHVGGVVSNAVDQHIQTQIGQHNNFTAGTGFVGIGISGGDTIGCAPPDTNAAVGSGYVVEIVNLCNTGVGEFKVWDTSGNVVLGTTSLSGLWSSGECASGNGDNQVTYDQFAHRWILSQFNGSITGICMAVSQTSDPTGAYYLYDVVIDPSGFTDYPKTGLWVTGDDNSDAYFITTNDFAATFADSFTAVQRSAMLAGNPAEVINAFDTSNLAGGALPADIDGMNMAPAGDPGLFANFSSPYLAGTGYQLNFWQMSVDWGAGTGTLTGPTALTVGTFNDGICGLSRSCIPQPSGGEGLDSLGDRLMFRLAYRNGNSHTSDQILVVNHTVGTGAAPSSPPAGIEWYQLDAPSGSTNVGDWSVAQQGTYMPADGNSRWMGSIAMDQVGNLGMGFTESSSSLNPSVAVTGQNYGAPSGVMDAGETMLVTGGGVQQSTSNRWGDYSSIMTDPADDCTFWTAQEYMSETGSFHWSTYIGSFKFDSCSAGPTGTVEGDVTDASNGNPIDGAKVTLTPGGASGTSDGNNGGHYSITTATGDYTAQACKFGYECSAQVPVTITDGGDVTQNFQLTPSTTATLSGRVYDAGHLYPLYAEVKIKNNGTTVADVWTSPVNGYYSVSLPSGNDYTMTATPYVSGFTDGSAAVTLSGDTTQSFPLQPDDSCTAPGYHYTGGISENFDGGTFPPDGWTVTNDVSGSPTVWMASSAEPSPYNVNVTGGSGDAADADSNAPGPGVGSYDTSLISPPIDVSSLSSTTLKWLENYVVFSGNEALDVDISTDGGTTWTNIEHYTSTCGTLYALPGCTPSPSVDIGSYLPGSGTFQLRWRYYNLSSDYDWYAQVDNVLLGAQCSAIPGQLLNLVATDANTHAGLTGVTITDENGNSVTTAANPGGGVPGAMMFEPSGGHSLTATKNNYQDNVKSVSVGSTGKAQTVLFRMQAGRLAVNPTSLSVNAPVGTTTSVMLHVGNSGSASLDWQLSSIDAPPAQPLNGGGARLNEEHCSGRISPASLLAPGKPGDCYGGNGGDSPSSNDPTWTAVADYPIPVLDGCMAKDETGTGLIYSVTGVSNGANTASDYVYDPSTDTWTAFANFPNGGLEKPTCAFINGKLYVADGWDGSGNNSAALNIYDPSTDSWSTGASTPYSTGGGAVGVALNGKLYVIGGCQNGSSCPGDSAVEVYDPSSDSWSSAAAYPGAMAWGACGAIAGEIYCAGGILNGSETPNTYVYDPSADTWTGGLAPIPVASGGLWGTAYTATADGQLLLQDGVTDNFATVTNEGFAYDVASDSWSSTPNNIVTTYRPGSACGFYQVGGQDGTFTGIQDAVVLPGYDVCSVGSVPWLSFNPASGTLAAGQATTSMLMIDGTGQTAGTSETVTVKLNGNTPYGSVVVPLTVNWTGSGPQKH